MNLQDFNTSTLRTALTLPEGKITNSSSVATYWQERKPSQPILTNIPGLIYQFLLRQDGSLNFLFLSPNFQEFFEIDSPEMEMDTETLISTIHPDDVAGFHESIAEAGGMLKSWKWAGRFILPSGQLKWIQWDAQPSLQKNGNIFWNGLLVDITSQQQLNAEVERLSFLLGLTERLQSSTDLKKIAQFALNYLVESTNCAFGDVKEIAGIEENGQACPLTDRISAKLITSYGKVSAEIRSNLPRTIHKGQGLLWQVVETGQPLFVRDRAHNSNSKSAFIPPENGNIGIFPIPATDGTVIGILTLESNNSQDLQDPIQRELLLAACRILGVRMERAKDRERLAFANRDLELTSARLKQQTQQLEETLDELQQAQIQLVQSEKMSSLGQLVAGVAHEINNPVSFIHGNIIHADRYFKDLLWLLNLYQQYYPEPAPEIEIAIEEIDLDFLSFDLPKLICSIKAGAERIRNIVRSLRNFSRLDHADKKIVDIHEGINNTLMILNNRLKSQPNRGEIKIIEEYSNLPLVECYAGQLNQVFMNLIANAIDAIEEDSRYLLAISNSKSSQQSTTNYPQPIIRIRTEVLENTRIRITIADNGPGIPESLQARIFDPFFTTKPAGKGTGLGLAISQRIITEQHGGQLHCISLPGKGTEFAIEIPLTPLD